MNQTGENMGFRRWLESIEIKEVTKPEQIDASSVELTRYQDYKFDPARTLRKCERDSEHYPSIEDCMQSQRQYHSYVTKIDGYVYPYEHGGKDFEVQMVRSPGYGEDIRRMLGDRSAVSPRDFWKVDLEGPQAFNLTGESGFEAIGVYLKMLAAIKKLMEVENPQGFVVIPSHDFMEPVYNKFINSFLQNSYVPLHPHIYVRSDVVDSAESHRKERIQTTSAQVSAMKSKKVRRIKWLKSIFRRMSSAPQPYIGKIVGFESDNKVLPAVVKNITMTKGIELLVYRSGFLRPFNVEPEDYYKIKDPDYIVAIFLRRMLEDAKKKNTEIGYAVSRIPSFDGTTAVMPVMDKDIAPTKQELEAERELQQEPDRELI